MAGKVLEWSKKLGILGGAFSDADAQAYFAFFVDQQVEKEELPQGIFTKFKRNDGGNWGFIGKEQGAVCRLSRKYFNNNMTEWTSCDKNSNKQDVFIWWNGYQSDCGNRPYKYDIPYNNYLTMLKVIAEGRDISDCSVMDKECLMQLVKQGFCVTSEDGEIQVAALTICYSNSEKIMEYLAALPEYRQLKEEMHTYFNEMRSIIARYSVPYLKEDFDYYVGMSSQLRSIFAALWIDKGLYTGGNSQFAALYY